MSDKRVYFPHKTSYLVLLDARQLSASVGRGPSADISNGNNHRASSKPLSHPNNQRVQVHQQVCQAMKKN